MWKIIGEGVWDTHRAIRVGRLSLLLTAFLACAASGAAAEPDPSALFAAILDHPMLEADFLPSDLPDLTQFSPPDLLLAPLPTIRPIPEDSPDPLPQQPENQPPLFALTPPLLVVQTRNPAFPAPGEIPDEATQPQPIQPMPPLIGEAAADPALPMAPEPATFARPQLSPPGAVAPNILGVPAPMLNPAPGEKPAPNAPVRLARRYSLQLQAALLGVYDDSAVIATNGNKPDLILALVPELALTLGSDQSRAAIRLAYAPALTWYTQGTNKDAVNQNVHLDSRYRTGKLTLGSSFSASTSTSGGTLETGQVSESQTYIGAITALCQFTRKTSADFTLDDTLQKNAGFSTSNEARLQGFGNYQWGKFKLGTGALFGLVDTQDASTQRYIQPLGRVIYAGDKLLFNASAGYEFRNLGEGNGQSSEPVVQVSAAYLPRAGTMLAVTTRRQVFASITPGEQNYVFTSYEGTLRQGFTGYGRNVFVSLSGGLQNNTYSQDATGTGGGEDRYLYIRLAFDWAFRKRCLIGGFYEYSDESAGREGSVGFKRNRVGMQATMIFF